MEYLDISGCLRVSMAPYNTFNEIDFFIATLNKIIQQENLNVKEKIKVESSYMGEMASENIINQFSKIKGWDSRHREIMLLGKQLERLKRNHRNEVSLISGCESLAWLIAIEDSQGKFTFQADSDAKIIRGLLVIVLAAYNNKTALQIKLFDIGKYFEQLGLMQHLSPSRGNGVLAIVEKIKELGKEK